MINSCHGIEELKQHSITDPQQSPALTSSLSNYLPTRAAAHTQTENFLDPSIYVNFFRAMQDPALIVDLNINSQEAKPHIMNPEAKKLIRTNMCFFSESYLEKHNGSLNDLIYSIKRKVSQQVSHKDVLRISTKDNNEMTERVFNLAASTFDQALESRLLLIILSEVPKAMKQELSALENFKGSLICALSHELNTPMNSLVPLLKMMPSFKGEDKKTDLREIALGSAILLQNKIRDLIDYVKIEMKNLKLEQSEFYVEDLFEDLKKVFQYEVKQKSNMLLTKVITNGNRKLLIMGDRNRIEQILVKLISNANKYTTNGSIYLNAAESKNDFNVTFSIADTGVGISKEKLGLIFAPLPEKSKHMDKFARLPGLGLDIAKSICAHMESTLIVASQEGKGTKFSFEIPTCRIAVFEDPSVVASSNSNSATEKEEFKRVESYSETIKVGADNFCSSLIEPIPTTKAPEEDCVHSYDPSPKSTELLTYKAMLSRWESTRRLIQHGEDTHKERSELRRTKFKPMRTKTQSRISVNTVGPLDPDLEICDEGIEVHALIPKYGSLISHSRVTTESLPITNVQKTKKIKKKGVVLITDDLYSNRMVIREMLKRINVPTIEAINGEEAVKEVEKSFDEGSEIEIMLILMDLNMPVMNGVDSTREIRKMERMYGKDDEIPIVAVTAHDTAGDKTACFEAGMQDHVLKPINNKALVRIVQEYASRMLKKNLL